MQVALRNSLATVACAIVASTAGAATSVSGVYVSKGAAGGSMDISVKFGPNGKAEITAVNMLGQKSITETSYKVEDEKVKIGANGQLLVWPIQKNGCLDGGAGVLGQLCKVKQ